MTFPLVIFKYIYYVFLMIWAVFCLVSVYHMIKFGMKNFVTFISTFVFIVGAAVLLFASFYFISLIDWTVNITIFEGWFTPQDMFF